MPAAPRVRAEIRPLVRLSLPLMIGLLAATMIGLVDTVMISPLGTVPLAAAGITSAVLIILISALWGVITVISVQISQATGARDRIGVSAQVRHGLALALVSGAAGAALMMAAFPLLRPLGQPDAVLAILLPYWASMALWIIPFTAFFALKSLFDAVGREWTGVALSYLGVVVNIPANYLLIHVAGLGILGAGLASVLSQGLSLAAAYAYLRLAPSMASYRMPTPLVPARIRRLASDAAPLCIGYAGEGGAYAMIGIMMGWLGATALAANQVVTAVAGLAYVVPLGLAGAISIRVGYAIGADEPARLRPMLRAGLGISVLWQSAIMILFILAGPTLSRLLSDDPDVIALAQVLFIAVALLQIADGIQGTSLGALRGLSDNRVPTLITLIAYWPLALPAAAALGLWAGFGAVGLWAGYTLGIVVAAIGLTWRFWRRTALAAAATPH